MKPVLFTLPFLIISVALLLRAELRSLRSQIYLWKPISTLLVIATLENPNFNCLQGLLVFGGAVLFCFGSHSGGEPVLETMAVPSYQVGFLLQRAGDDCAFSQLFRSVIEMILLDWVTGSFTLRFLVEGKALCPWVSGGIHD